MASHQEVDRVGLGQGFDVVKLVMYDLRYDEHSGMVGQVRVEDAACSPLPSQWGWQVVICTAR